MHFIFSPRITYDTHDLFSFRNPFLPFYMYHKYLPTQCSAFRKNKFSGMVIKALQLDLYLPGYTSSPYENVSKMGFI